MGSSSPIEAILRHDRVVILSGLAGLAALAWAHMIQGARAMDDSGMCACLGMAMSGPDIRPWAVSTIPPLFLMWAEMMVAMMIPSVAPTILVFARVNRQRREQNRPFVHTGWFLLGYLCVWFAFSLVAAGAQWALHGTGVAFAGDERDEPAFGRRGLDRSRGVSVDSLETRLPEPLSFAP